MAKKSPASVPFRPRRIISGGQTGVDRGALDAAVALAIPHGGWCPKGRLAEDGSIPSIYQLTETDSRAYTVRTEKNVLDSNATLIICRGQPRGGTELTLRLARQHRRPHLVVDLKESPAIVKARRWLAKVRPSTLNVAGPRASQAPGIAAEATQWLVELLT